MTRLCRTRLSLRIARRVLENVRAGRVVYEQRIVAWAERVVAQEEAACPA